MLACADDIATFKTSKRISFAGETSHQRSWTLKADKSGVLASIVEDGSHLTAGEPFAVLVDTPKDFEQFATFKLKKRPFKLQTKW